MKQLKYGPTTEEEFLDISVEDPFSIMGGYNKNVRFVPIIKKGNK